MLEKADYANSPFQTGVTADVLKYSEFRLDNTATNDVLEVLKFEKPEFECEFIADVNTCPIRMDDSTTVTFHYIPTIPSVSLLNKYSPDYREQIVSTANKNTIVELINITEFYKTGRHHEYPRAKPASEHTQNFLKKRWPQLTWLGFNALNGYAMTEVDLNPQAFAVAEFAIMSAATYIPAGQKYQKIRHKLLREVQRQKTSRNQKAEKLAEKFKLIHQM